MGLAFISQQMPHQHTRAVRSHQTNQMTATKTRRRLRPSSPWSRSLFDTSAGNVGKVFWIKRIVVSSLSIFRVSPSWVSARLGNECPRIHLHSRANELMNLMRRFLPVCTFASPRYQYHCAADSGRGFERVVLSVCAWKCVGVQKRLSSCVLLSVVSYGVIRHSNGATFTLGQSKGSFPTGK